MNPSELNNHGVELLVTGDLEGALHAFRQAIMTLEQVLDDDEEENGEPTQEHLSLMIRAHPSAYMSSTCSDCYIYKHAIRFVEDTTRATIASHVEVSTGAILFNVALTLHTKAMLRRQAQLFRRALNCYESCSSAVREDANIDSMALHLLSQNNAAQIHFSEFSDFEQARDCVNTTAGILSRLDRSHFALRDEGDFIGVWWNTFLLGRPLAAARSA